MPIQRFRTFDEARRALWVDSHDAGLANRIRRLWDFARRLSPGSPVRGLRKFRTLDEARRERDEWTRRRIGSARQRSSGKDPGKPE